ncbi:MAG: S8 family serine peptidase [Bacteroidota bacterium]
MDTYLHQLQMVGLDKLHQAGYSGEGVLIAVFDNGFLGVDTINGFEHLFRENRIYAARDFVDGDDNVYESCNHCRHGTNVLSILAAKMPGYLIGTAPDASYLLLRTEDDSRENPQEEDNWLAAAEYADSLGAQVFTTSLGYFDFDGEENDYQLSDLDGNTATITRAGDIAASKGIIVVNSAGNSGTRGINAPADGDSILAIAAVDQCQDLAPFSSRGPSFDGRIKPELAAMGSGNTLLRHDGSLARGSGTSFSCPIISGLTACLLQAAPNASNLEMYDALFQSASQFDAPDFDIGYGIPDGAEALRILAGSEAIQKGPTDFPLSILYPNPNQGAFDLIFQPNALPARIEVDIIDLQGRSVFQDVFSLSAIRPQIHIETALQAGLYHINLQEMESGQRLEGKKLWIR